MRTSAERRGEAMARDAFRARLRSAGLAHGEWRRGAEPPDYYLRWQGISLAVEVTRVMDSHAVGVGEPVSTHGVRASLEGLIMEVRHTAVTEGILSGTYVIYLAPIASLKQYRSNIVSSAIEHIRETQATAEGPRLVLHRQPPGRVISIQKVGSSGAHVGGWISPGTMKRAPAIRADLRRLCAATLAKKKRQLARTRLPRLLLLIDSYLYGEQADWAAVAGGLDLTGWHTVARVADRDVCHVLYSLEPSWR